MARHGTRTRPRGLLDRGRHADLGGAESDPVARTQHLLGRPDRVQSWQKALDDAALRETLRARALDVGRRYRGRFAEYDLKHEMLHANYYEDRLGAGITARWPLGSGKAIRTRSST